MLTTSILLKLQNPIKQSFRSAGIHLGLVTVYTSRITVSLGSDIL